MKIFFIELICILIFILIQIVTKNFLISTLFSFLLLNLNFVFLKVAKSLYQKANSKALDLLGFLASLLLSFYITTIIANVLIFKRIYISQNEFVIISSILFSLIVAFLVALNIINKKLYAKEVENERLKAINLQTHLQVLQRKLNPHFLFNTLNTIAETTHISPQRAEEMILLLAKFYRKILLAPTVWKLSEEIDFLKEYLELQKLRYNFEFIINIPSNIENLEFPALVLQPIVENAFKYGNRENLILKIEVRKEDDFLIVDVLNTGSLPEKVTFGEGLSIVKNRLEHFCKDSFLRFTQKDEFVLFSLGVLLSKN